MLRAGRPVCSSQFTVYSLQFAVGIMPHASEKINSQMGHCVVAEAFVVADINGYLHLPLLPTMFGPLPLKGRHAFS